MAATFSMIFSRRRDGPAALQAANARTSVRTPPVTAARKSSIHAMQLRPARTAPGHVPGLATALQQASARTLRTPGGQYFCDSGQSIAHAALAACGYTSGMFESASPMTISRDQSSLSVPTWVAS